MRDVNSGTCMYMRADYTLHRLRAMRLHAHDVDPLTVTGTVGHDNFTGWNMKLDEKCSCPRNIIPQKVTQATTATFSSSTLINN